MDLQSHLRIIKQNFGAFEFRGPIAGVALTPPKYFQRHFGWAWTALSIVINKNRCLCQGTLTLKQEGFIPLFKFFTWIKKEMLAYYVDSGISLFVKYAEGILLKFPSTPCPWQPLGFCLNKSIILDISYKWSSIICNFFVSVCFHLA